MSSHSGHQFVKAGSCMNGGDGRICALQREDCPNGTIFTTPRQLDQSGGGLAHGGACATRLGTEETVKIGWCPNEGCASDASMCTNPSSFVSVDDRCTIRNDGTRTDGKQDDTLFGFCTSDSICYWSDTDCSSGWSPPAYANTAGRNFECTCDKVRVGACFDQGFYYCAVSADACDESSEWFSAKTLLGRDSAPDCFLCIEDDYRPVANPTPVAVSTPAPVVPPQAKSSSVLPEFKHAHKVSKQEDTVLTVTLGVFGVLVFLSGLAIYCIRRKRGPRKTNKEVSDIPLDTPTVSQVNVGYEEDDCVSEI